MGEGGVGDGLDWWETVKRGARPLQGRHPHPRHTPPASSRSAAVAAQPSAAGATGSAAVVVVRPPAPQPLQIDRSTREKLRKGRMPIEARLDMHGMTRAEAHRALADFVYRRQAAGLRCVLVVTGKGRGILRADSLRWLREAPLAPLVLETVPARPRDGGDGAFYVLLRRRR